MVLITPLLKNIRAQAKNRETTDERTWTKRSSDIWQEATRH
ncbi:MAG: hypothetical protein U9N48_03950 [Euryarchaeota archaeon]|nr:hypothetical protein [Euryarchaeota archaeon]